MGKDNEVVGVDDIGETVTVEDNLGEGIVRKVIVEDLSATTNYEKVLTQRRVCTVIS